MAGKLWFAILHAILFAVWIIANVGLVPGIKAFDPYPFQLLADQRSHLDLRINMQADAESTASLKMLRALCAHPGLDFDNDAEITNLLQETEPKTLVKELKKELPDHS